MRDGDGVIASEPFVRVVLLVEHRFPAHRHLDRKVLDRDLVDSGEVFAAHLVGNPITLRHPNVDDRRVEAGLLAELTSGGFGERLTILDHTGDYVPVVVDCAVQHQELVAPLDDDRGLSGRPQSAATAACSFAVASPAGVPAGKYIGSPNTTSTLPRQPLERDASHFRSRWSSTETLPIFSFIGTTGVAPSTAMSPVPDLKGCIGPPIVSLPSG